MRMCSNGNETGLIGSAAGPKAALETMFGVFVYRTVCRTSWSLLWPQHLWQLNSFFFSSILSFHHRLSSKLWLAMISCNFNLTFSFIKPQLNLMWASGPIFTAFFFLCSVFLIHGTRNQTGLAPHTRYHCGVLVSLLWAFPYAGIHLTLSTCHRGSKLMGYEVMTTFPQLIGTGQLTFRREAGIETLWLIWLLYSLFNILSPIKFISQFLNLSSPLQSLS